MPGFGDAVTAAGEAPLTVRVLRSIRGEPLLESQLDALNLASRRPTPFNGRGFLAAFLYHDEFGGPDQAPRLLAALSGERLVGFLPLRRCAARALGRTEPKVEFLVTHDNDRPDLVARPEDERRCAEAFWRHLLGEGRDWSVLELVNLEPGSPLLPAPGQAFPGAFARAVDGLPTALIPTPQADLAAWYRTLKKGWRHTVARLGRRFLGAGAVELVTCRDPRARLALLDLYLDLERRSWKRQHGMGRHPARLALHRALCAPDADLALSFQLLLLDGVVVSGFIFGEFAGTLYGMETCYDAAYERLGPGNLMSLLSAGEALRRRAPSLNLFADFAYYKGNWGAELLPTRTLQLFRAGSAHWARARLGDVKRAVAGTWLGGQAGRFNRVKREVEAGAGSDDGGAPGAEAAPSGPPDRSAERALAARILGELGAAGIPLERLAGPALEAALPFAAAKGDKAG